MASEAPLRRFAAFSSSIPGIGGPIWNQRKSDSARRPVPSIALEKKAGRSNAGSAFNHWQSMGENRSMRRVRGSIRGEATPSRPAPRKPSNVAGGPAPSGWPLSVHHVDEDQIADMEPGDVIALDQAPTLRTRTACVFSAVISCPVCGQCGLLTAPQYFGVIPVICASDDCSCRFRIYDRSLLVYLPVN